MRTLGCCAWLACAACGVHEYRHHEANVDGRNDFGPQIDAGSGVQSAATDPADSPTLEPFDAGETAPPQDAAADGGEVETSTPLEGGAAVDSPSDAGATASDATEAAASSEATITLGGVELRKADVIAFIHFGHSNMAGRATKPQSERGYFFDFHPHAFMYHLGRMPEPAVEPFTAGDQETRDENRAGPGTALLKRALELAPKKYFLSLGFGQGKARCKQFLPGSLYYDSITQAAIAVKDRVTFGAIVIMLGITEDDVSDRADYTACIDQLVRAIRKDIDQPELPVLLTDYERGSAGRLAVTGPFAQSIIPEIQKLPGLVSKLALVPTDGIQMEDDHHFDFVGYKEWTRRALQLMQNNGWFPWAEPTPTP